MLQDRVWGGLSTTISGNNHGPARNYQLDSSWTDQYGLEHEQLAKSDAVVDFAAWVNAVPFSSKITTPDKRAKNDEHVQVWAVKNRRVHDGSEVIIYKVYFLYKLNENILRC